MIFNVGSRLTTTFLSKGTVGILSRLSISMGSSLSLLLSPRSEPLSKINTEPRADLVSDILVSTSYMYVDILYPYDKYIYDEAHTTNPKIPIAKSAQNHCVHKCV